VSSRWEGKRGKIQENESEAKMTQARVLKIMGAASRKARLPVMKSQQEGDNSI